ncbi:MAG: hypothetical protein IJ881_04180 [Neisseriaceae bacterium]|nr:hypothetical protein [Neisseriaceae bacterium]MBR3425867.1 hypothetical protein [Neisseriaceae bacterium]
MFEKLFKKDTDDKQIERLTFEQLTLQEKGLILVYRECNHNILKACSQILTTFAEKQGHPLQFTVTTDKEQRYVIDVYVEGTKIEGTKQDENPKSK